MSDPSLELQGAFARILNAAALSCEGKLTPVYDRVPKAATPPYVVIGDDQVIPDAADCLEGSSEVYSQVHCFYYGGKGKAGAKALAKQVIAAISNAEIDLGDEFALVLIRFDGTRYLEEPGGETTHAVVTFRALIDAA